jgi:hypothetical protein
MTASRLSLPTFLLLCAFTSQARAQEAMVVPLWPSGAPGFEARKDEPENVKKKGKLEQSVTNVHNPSLTVYLPAQGKASGAGIIICPGGGHSVLAIEHEGHNVGQWLANNGIVIAHRDNVEARDDLLLRTVFDEAEPNNNVATNSPNFA